MKISLEWLAEYLSHPISADEAAEALTHGGLPVEHFEKHGDDTVIDVEVTSNRGDCLSHIGIAREIAALTGRDLKLREPVAPQTAPSALSATSVQIDALRLCPHYTARILRGIRIGPSPAWMARRLEAVGIRPISNIVDVTNYVMFEMGQPLHAFDFDKLHGQRIVVRAARPGEKLTTIDGKQRTLSESMLVIADADHPAAIAGVMGGLESEVTGATTNLLLESARFDPLSVRRTSRALDLMSDSSYRFERQIDPQLPERASLRAAQLMLEAAGGQLLEGVVAAGSPSHQPKQITLRLSRQRQLLGVELHIDAIMNALTRLGLSPQLSENRASIATTIPSHRLDLNVEVDLIEEVARVVGYDKIPLRDEISIRVPPPDPDARTMEQIRALLVAGGYFESITFSFVSDALAGDFLPSHAKSLPRTENVKWRTDNQLRPSMLPGLLESVRRNETTGTLGAQLFEIGPTFWNDPQDRLIERRRIGLVGSADYRELRGTIELLLSRLNRDLPVEIIPDSHPGYAQGAAGTIRWGGQPIGQIGKVARPIAEKLSLRELPTIAEIDLDPLLEKTQHVPQQRPLAKFPPIRRDLSLVLPEKTPFADLQQLVHGLSLEHLEDLEYVTTYRGKPLEKGFKSVTVRLVFRSPQATLTSEQVEPAMRRVADEASRAMGATLRV